MFCKYFASISVASSVLLYIFMYIHNEFITSWTIMFNEAVLKGTEILLPSLGLTKHIHDMINLLYYKHWTDKQKYIPYISVAHKVLKSCRSKMATWCMWCTRSFFMYMELFTISHIYMGDGRSIPTSQKFANSPHLEKSPSLDHFTPSIFSFSPNQKSIPSLNTNFQVITQ